MEMIHTHELGIIKTVKEGIDVRCTAEQLKWLSI